MGEIASRRHWRDTMKKRRATLILGHQVDNIFRPLWRKAISSRIFVSHTLCLTCTRVLLLFHESQMPHGDEGSNVSELPHQEPLRTEQQQKRQPHRRPHSHQLRLRALPDVSSTSLNPTSPRPDRRLPSNPCQCHLQGFFSASLASASLGTENESTRPVRSRLAHSSGK